MKKKNDSSSTPTAHWPRIGSLTVGGKVIPILIVPDRIFIEGVRVPGVQRGADHGGTIELLLSHHLNKKEIIDAVGRAFVCVMEDLIEKKTGKPAIFDDTPGVGDGLEMLPDPAPDEESLPAGELAALADDFNAAVLKIVGAAQEPPPKREDGGEERKAT